ncbi:MAG: hypothetical protein UY35_C0017G0017 [Candidatus Saccharibacteria bacterium GW2011_GWC2_48_9]|nr:MAG: hypothetical protein UY35_C0017G0017 [Candidatus Saccharibacteria bacterium GW2011_GWC2_48_9]
MSQKQTVTINGRNYDARTGLPVSDDSSRTTRASLRGASAPSAPVATAHKPKTPAAHQIHHKTQRSKTLNRKFTKKPVASKPHTATAVQPQTVIHHSAPRMDGIKRMPIASSPTRATLAMQKKKSPALTTRPRQTAAQHNTQTLLHKQPHHNIDTPMKHPSLERAHKVQAAKKAAPQQALPSASVIKQAVIKEALDTAPKHHAKQHKRGVSYKQKLTGVVCGCAALILFGGYLTYLNVPNLSVRVAAAQAGIDASYPGYQPDGYRLNGPVAFSEGQVRIQFAANTGDADFTLNQSASSWDSSALLENYVKEKSDNEYNISQEKGLTIYSYNSNAAWVSGGILYTIDGDAPLSPDQIRKIATSIS